MLNVCLIESFYTGSHKQWADGLRKYSQHNIEILSLPGRHWKWRMHGAAITLASEYEKRNGQSDLILATDLLDLNIFLSLCRNSMKPGLPVALYMHENQLAYPWSPADEDKEKGRDRHYMFIQYASALCADRVWFNSNYNLQSFMHKLAGFLKPFPDYRNEDSVKAIKTKSSVLPLAIDYDLFGRESNQSQTNPSQTRHFVEPPPGIR